VNQKANGQTLLAKPLVDIVSMFVPKAYEKSLGEMFYNESIVSLVHLLDLYTNKLNRNFKPEFGVYENESSPETAFKALNLDLDSVNQFIMELLGNDKGEDNVFSRALKALGQPDDTPGGFMNLIGFNLKAAFEAFGMTGESSFKKDQFAGLLVRWSLPLLATEGDS
jgi:hypothetical protein